MVNPARTRTVSNTLQHPGTASPYRPTNVTIRLNVPGFINGGTAEKIRTRYVTPDATGLWSVDLEVNADIDPAGTSYTVHEAAGIAWTFIVPAGDAAVPVNLRDILVVDPANPNPLVAGIPLPSGQTPGKVATVDSTGNGVEWDTPAAGGVTSFQTRTGAVSLTKADVTGTGLAASDVGAQPVDADLTTIAALDATTAAGALVTDGAGWIRKTYAQLKTALGLGGAAVLNVGTTAGTVAAGDDARFGQGLPANFVSKSAAYTGGATAAAGDFVEADTTAGGFTIPLPLNPANGALVTTMKISGDTNTVTIAPSGGGTINGSPTETTVTQWAVITWEHRGGNVWRSTSSLTGPAGTNGTNGVISAVQDEGTPLTARANLNFVGAGVTATDDAANSRTIVTIPGGTTAATGLLPRALKTGRYYTTPGTMSSLTMGRGFEYAFLFEVFASTSFTAIGLSVTTAQTSSVIRLGVRADNAGLPGAVTFDAGSNIDASTTGLKEIAITQTLAAGIYWLCGRATGGSADPVVAGSVGMPVMIGSLTQAGAMSNNCAGYSDNGGGSGAIAGTMAAFNQSVTMPRVCLKVA